MNLRIGSRGSALALWQANHIAGLLRAAGQDDPVGLPEAIAAMVAELIHEYIVG